MTISAENQALIDNALALVTSIGPSLGANGAIAAAVVSIGASAIKAASNNGADVTDAQLFALFDQFEANKLDDLLAQREARARGDTSGAAVASASTSTPPST